MCKRVSLNLNHILALGKKFDKEEFRHKNYKVSQLHMTMESYNYFQFDVELKGKFK